VEPKELKDSEVQHRISLEEKNKQLEEKLRKAEQAAAAALAEAQHAKLEVAKTQAEIRDATGREDGAVNAGSEKVNKGTAGGGAAGEVTTYQPPGRKENSRAAALTNKPPTEVSVTEQRTTSTAVEDAKESGLEVEEDDEGSSIEASTNRAENMRTIEVRDNFHNRYDREDKRERRDRYGDHEDHYRDGDRDSYRHEDREWYDRGERYHHTGRDRDSDRDRNYRRKDREYSSERRERQRNYRRRDREYSSERDRDYSSGKDDKHRKRGGQAYDSKYRPQDDQVRANSEGSVKETAENASKEVTAKDTAQRDNFAEKVSQAILKEVRNEMQQMQQQIQQQIQPLLRKEQSGKVTETDKATAEKDNTISIENVTYVWILCGVLSRVIMALNANPPDEPENSQIWNAIQANGSGNYIEKHQTQPFKLASTIAQYLLNQRLIDASEVAFNPEDLQPYTAGLGSSGNKTFGGGRLANETHGLGGGNNGVNRDMSGGGLSRLGNEGFSKGDGSFGKGNGGHGQPRRGPINGGFGSGRNGNHGPSKGEFGNGGGYPNRGFGNGGGPPNGGHGGGGDGSPGGKGGLGGSFFDEDGLDPSEYDYSRSPGRELLLLMTQGQGARNNQEQAKEFSLELWNNPYNEVQFREGNRQPLKTPLPKINDVTKIPEQGLALMHEMESRGYTAYEAQNVLRSCDQLETQSNFYPPIKFDPKRRVQTHIKLDETIKRRPTPQDPRDFLLEHIIRLLEIYFAALAVVIDTSTAYSMMTKLTLIDITKFSEFVEELCRLWQLSSVRPNSSVFIEQAMRGVVQYDSSLSDQGKQPFLKELVNRHAKQIVAAYEYSGRREINAAELFFKVAMNMEKERDAAKVMIGAPSMLVSGDPSKWRQLEDDSEAQEKGKAKGKPPQFVDNGRQTLPGKFSGLREQVKDAVRKSYTMISSGNITPTMQNLLVETIVRPEFDSAEAGAIDEFPKDMKISIEDAKSMCQDAIQKREDFMAAEEEAQREKEAEQEWQIAETGRRLEKKLVAQVERKIEELASSIQLNNTSSGYSAELSPEGVSLLESSAAGELNPTMVHSMLKKQEFQNTFGKLGPGQGNYNGYSGRGTSFPPKLSPQQQRTPPQTAVQFSNRPNHCKTCGLHDTACQAIMPRRINAVTQEMQCGLKEVDVNGQIDIHVHVLDKSLVSELTQAQIDCVIEAATKDGCMQKSSPEQIKDFKDFIMSHRERVRQSLGVQRPT
jgi:hypothetical protein